jgi:tetratricopeptide (TPR) repeat protein
VRAITPLAYETYQQALAQQQEGHIDTAIQTLRRAHGQDPDDVLILLRLSMLLHQQGRQNEATRLAERAAVLAPQDPWLSLTLGGYYEQQDRWSDAEAAYRQGLRAVPDFHYGWLNLGRVMAQQGRKKVPQALRAYQQFLAVYPAHFDARRTLAQLQLAHGQERQAIATFEALRTEYPQKFSDYLEYARALNRVQSHRAALDILREAPPHTVGAADLYEEAGHAMAALGQRRGAMQRYQKALALDPKRWALSLPLGHLALEENQPQEAMAQYQTYLRHRADSLPAQEGLAQAQMATGAYPAALDTLNLLLDRLEKSSPGTAAGSEISPDTVLSLKKQRGLAFQKLGRLPEAIASYETAAVEDPTDVQLQRNLAIAYHQARAYDKAKRAYEALLRHPALANQPEDVAVLNKDLATVTIALAREALNRQDPQGALALLKPPLASAAAATGGQVLSPSPQVAPFNPATPSLPWLKTLAEAYAATGDTAAAITTTREALTLAPEDETLWLSLGGLLQNSASLETEKTSQEALGPSSSSPPLPEISPAGTTPSSPKQVDTRLQETLDAYQRARNINPNNALAAFNVGTLHQQLGQWQEAMVAFRDALRLNPQLPEAHYGMALSLDRMQQPQDALRAYETYLRQPSPAYTAEARQRADELKTYLQQKQRHEVQPTPAAGLDTPVLRTQPQAPHAPTRRRETPPSARRPG